jgi:hypothetical protein
MNAEIEWDLKGNDHGLIEVLSWHLSAGTKESHKKPQSRHSLSWLKFKVGKVYSITARPTRFFRAGYSLQLMHISGTLL